MGLDGCTGFTVLGSGSLGNGYEDTQDGQAWLTGIWVMAAVWRTGFPMKVCLVFLGNMSVIF